MKVVSMKNLALGMVLFFGFDHHINAALIHANGDVTETTNLAAGDVGPPEFSIAATSDGVTNNHFVTREDDDAAFNSSPPILVIDLGSDLSIDAAAFWNYSPSSANGTSAFALEFATSADGTSGFGTSIAYNPTFNPTQVLTQQDFAFAQNVTARYIQLTLLNNFVGSGAARIGLNEIQFNQIVPEPTTIGLLVIGGLTMFTFRRRR